MSERVTFEANAIHFEDGRFLTKAGSDEVLFFQTRHLVKVQSANMKMNRKPVRVRVTVEVIDPGGEG